MKANELRIGNYVQSLDDNNIPSLGMELMEIVGIKHNGEGYYNPKHEIGKRYKDLEQHGWFSEDCELFGIPLTEDILLKCGFNQFKNDFGYKSIKWTLEDNQFNLQTDFFYLVFIKQYGKNKGKRMFEVRTWGRKLVAIDYLHQLQNLYFALTGEELNVNL